MAQHPHGNDEEHDDHHAHDEHDMDEAPSFLSRNLPMTVNGSGTAWHPTNSPMYMNFTQSGAWNMMLHYGIFPAYTFQNPHNPDYRGTNEFFMPTWVMGMANRKVGKRGLLSVRGMLSADPLIMGGNGYPLLYQTGETYQGEPLIDRQHPHDLFSELSIAYSYAFTEDIDGYVYLGYPGEPALGPPAFMHRPSGLNIPDSPLGHHWQDATHIIYGVATTGFRYKRLRIEGSWFTGREPGEDRLWFDEPRFDSFSGRINYLLGKSLALQASYSYLHSPEVHEPERDVNRLTASILHNVWLNTESVLSSSLVYGLNRSWDRAVPDDILPSNSFLLESALQASRFNLFVRAELLEKSFHELGIGVNDHHNNNGHNDHHIDEYENVWIGAIKPGASVYLLKNKHFWLDGGFTVTFHRTSPELISYYGAQNTMAYQVFLRMIPPMMRH
ncbi:hypothetical protein RCC89_15930 [Cytophagaceae bacterium ABcell3]|nr:hypothetical protein RCC89_15930 [Cytophagaceae bacterium ABcell3]